jgi:hypothetical protein
MSEKKNASDETGDSEPRTKTEQEVKAETGETRKSRYEFKILPVNPKNSFDFEDVADK